MVPSARFVFTRPPLGAPRRALSHESTANNCNFLLILRARCASKGTTDLRRPTPRFAESASPPILSTPSDGSRRYRPRCRHENIHKTELCRARTGRLETSRYHRKQGAVLCRHEEKYE